MSTRDFRVKIRGIILTITGLIVFILILRVVFDLIAVPSSNVIGGLVANISDVLVQPFANIVNPSTTISSNLNYDALISIGIYILLGIAISEVVTAFLYDSFAEIFNNVVDAIFKIVEFLIVLRIIFDFFKVSDISTFVQIIRGLTEWTANLIKLTFLDGRINVSTILVLFIVVVLDAIAESFINALIGQSALKKTVRKTTAIVPPPTQPVQHITVNVPPAQHVYNQRVQPVIGIPVQNGQQMVVRQPVYVPVQTPQYAQPVPIQPPPPQAPNNLMQNGNLNTRNPAAGYTTYHDGKIISV